MNTETRSQFIRSIDLGPAPARLPRTRAATRGVTPTATDPDALPDGVIVGTNMLSFSGDLPAPVRGAVAFSLLLAQEAAKADPVSDSPDRWVARHDSVLQTLGWVSTGGLSQLTHYDKADLAVHQSILPLLTLALGPAAAASALIITGLTQLQKIDEDKPWITLFDRESRRFEHNEYRFVTAEPAAGGVLLRIAAFRFTASAKRIQVLFFKTKDVDFELTVATRTLSADAGLLDSLRAPLEAKLADRAKILIESIELPAI